MSSYFVLAILDQPFRSTITKYSVTEDSSTKHFTIFSAIKSFTFIRCFTIKSSITKCSSINYFILFYLLYFTVLAVCVYYHFITVTATAITITTITAAVIISSLLLFWLLLVRRRDAIE